MESSTRTPLIFVLLAENDPTVRVKAAVTEGSHAR